MSARIILAKGREKSLLRRHPWIFSGAIERVEGKPLSGETLDVFDKGGNWLARAAWSADSQIRGRVWTFDRDEQIDQDFFVRRLQQAQQWRNVVAARDDLTGYRLIAGESDGLPGITIDRYDNFLVLQLLSSGAEFQRLNLMNALRECYPECNIYERSDVAVRKKEGLKQVTGLLHG
ncbi:MAG: 23S rRNA (cytosine(1962)-C(5))-methyltransferase RlmI, partial [Plesiomonas shigelloides]